MLVNWRLADEHYFRCLKGIPVIESELESKVFTGVKSTLSALKLNVPDIFDFIDYVKF